MHLAIELFTCLSMFTILSIECLHVFAYCINMVVCCIGVLEGFGLGIAVVLWHNHQLHN